MEPIKGRKAFHNWGQSLRFLHQSKDLEYLQLPFNLLLYVHQIAFLFIFGSLVWNWAEKELQNLDRLSQTQCENFIAGNPDPGESPGICYHTRKERGLIRTGSEILAWLKVHLRFSGFRYKTCDGAFTNHEGILQKRAPKRNATEALRIRTKEKRRTERALIYWERANREDENVENEHWSTEQECRERPNENWVTKLSEPPPAAK